MPEHKELSIYIARPLRFKSNFVDEIYYYVGPAKLEQYNNVPNLRPLDERKIIFPFSVSHKIKDNIKKQKYSELDREPYIVLTADIIKQFVEDGTIELILG